jgi:hypothetical protein
MYYDNIAKKLIGKLSKTDIMAFILSIVINDSKVYSNQYMIIASYCLKKFREIGDLDVIISINGYKKLKKNKNVKISKAKISKDEKIILPLPCLGKNSEIEFFPKKLNQGFPSSYFSISNLKKKNKLIMDDFGNPYYNIETCIKQYSDVKKVDNEYYLGKYKINKNRVIKNLKHLKTINNQMKNNSPKLLLTSIKNLEKLL